MKIGTSERVDAWRAVRDEGYAAQLTTDEWREIIGSAEWNALQQEFPYLADRFIAAYDMDAAHAMTWLALRLDTTADEPALGMGYEYTDEDTIDLTVTGETLATSIDYASANGEVTSIDGRELRIAVHRA